jgi:hypothetical protein
VPSLVDVIVEAVRRGDVSAGTTAEEEVATLLSDNALEGGGDALEGDRLARGQFAGHSAGERWQRGGVAVALLRRCRRPVSQAGRWDVGHLHVVVVSRHLSISSSG